jgi:hypothetical protein
LSFDPQIKVGQLDGWQPNANRGRANKGAAATFSFSGY